MTPFRSSRGIRNPSNSRFYRREFAHKWHPDWFGRFVQLTVCQTHRYTRHRRCSSRLIDIAADVAIGVVCPLVTLVGSAITAEAMETPFAGRLARAQGTMYGRHLANTIEHIICARVTTCQISMTRRTARWVLLSGVMLQQQQVIVGQ